MAVGMTGGSSGGSPVTAPGQQHHHFDVGLFRPILKWCSPWTRRSSRADRARTTGPQNTSSVFPSDTAASASPTPGLLRRKTSCSKRRAHTRDRALAASARRFPSIDVCDGLAAAVSRGGGAATDPASPPDGMNRLPHYRLRAALAICSGATNKSAQRCATGEENI